MSPAGSRRHRAAPVDRPGADLAGDRPGDQANTPIGAPIGPPASPAPAPAPDPAALARVTARAEAICAARGVRLTTHRRRVLQVICTAGRPMGAYEILDLIRDGAPAAPPTVYRALDFLLAQGLVHRLATLHAYVGCTHPEHPHASQFLICADCGGVTEVEDAAVADSLRQVAADTGFRPSQPVVEVLGTCAACADRPAATTPATEPAAADA